MGLPKFSSVSMLSLAGVVLLVGGLGIAIFASQHSTENRSHAATSSACGDTSAPTGTLLSQGAQTSASNTYQTFTSNQAVDGNTGTAWNSGDYPTQWIEINLGSKKTVTGLKLHVSQYPIIGHTVHQIFAGSNSNPATLVRTLDCTTATDQVINAVFSQPLTDTQYVRITTTSSPSWVAWTEIEVYGENPMVSQPPPQNQAPTADAGPDQTIALPDTSVDLDGTGSSDPDGTVATYTWTKKSGPSGETYTNKNTATPTVSGLQQGTYVFQLVVKDNQGLASQPNTVTITVSGCSTDSQCTSPKICQIATGQCVDPGSTILNFTLFLHGIGKGGDNVLDNDPNHDPSTNTGTTPPLHLQRAVTVEVHNPTDNSLVVSKPGIAIFNTTAGNFGIANFDMGTTLTTRTYKITVISQSLRKSILADVTAGVLNTIPVMRLVNGDANQDGVLNILDYNLISGCVSDPDFGQVATDCDPTRAAQSDIDDNGKVNIFDLNLLIREFSVQAL